MYEQKETVDFGFKRVTADQKPHLVQDVFQSVAGSYDLMNDLMSLGIHRLWKNQFINMLAPRPHMHLLDVAGGTGDIAQRFLKAGGKEVTVCDLTPQMVIEGRNKAINKNILSSIQWVVGDAQKLPFLDQSMDAYTIAFGLRNVTAIEEALLEAFRVLKPGGRFLCLEFSKVILPVLDKIYDTYSFKMLPWLGEVIAKDRASYQYLVESIRRFPAQEVLCETMRKVGFEQVSYRNLSGGITAIHSGYRL